MNILWNIKVNRGFWWVGASGLYAFLWIAIFSKTNLQNSDTSRYESLMEHAKEESHFRKYYNISTQSIVNPVNNPFILDSRNTCRNAEPYLLIFVPSKPDRVNIRQAIRQTFAQLSVDRTSQINNLSVDHVIRTVFILGRSVHNESLDRDVYDEGVTYDDVVLVDFIDSYYNLTMKVLHALKWVNLYCNNTQFVMKSDDDVFVNVAILLKQLKSHVLSPNGTIFGHLLNKTRHFVVERSGLTKWGVTYGEYPLNRYPPYLQGTSYIMTSDLVPKIVRTAQWLPYLHIEDVFVTGIIAQNIHGAELVQLHLTSNHADSIPNSCVFVARERLSQSSVHPDLMYKIWNALMFHKKMCKATQTHHKWSKWNKSGNHFIAELVVI